jgi:hypothetical protein
MILRPFLHSDPVAISYEAAFVRLMLEEVPAPPPHAAELRGLNAGRTRV